MRSVAARIAFLTEQVRELDTELTRLVPAHSAGPAPLAEPGVGPVVAAQVLINRCQRAMPARGHFRPSRPRSNAATQFSRAVDMQLCPATRVSRGVEPLGGGRGSIRP